MRLTKLTDKNCWVVLFLSRWSLRKRNAAQPGRRTMTKSSAMRVGVIAAVQFAAAMAIALWPAGGWAQSEGPAEFKPAINQKFEARSEPAKVTSEEESALVSKGGKYDDTPLMEAAKSNRLDLVGLLLANGADVNAKNTAGFTALSQAVEFGGKGKDLAGLLVANGADVNVKDSMDNTPLHDAAMAGYEEAAAVLLAKGADPNAKGYKGNTPLHDVAATGSWSKSLAELLLARGADVNARNDEGLTPLAMAIRSNHTEIADLLRQHGGHE
jgi:ankyrin repeat protein